MSRSQRRANRLFLPGPGQASGSAVRVSVFYGLLFVGIGVMLPFWPAWLETRGLGAVEIGLVMAAAQWSKVLVNPIIASHVDRTGARRAAMIALALASLTGFLVLQPMMGFWPVFLVAVPATACMAGLMPLSESVAMGVVRATGADYGRMRLWGSITFTVAAVAAGVLLDILPVTVVVPAAILGALAVTVAGAAALPADDARPAPVALSGSLFPWRGDGLARLLREPVFLLFLGCVGLSQASHAPYYGFSTLHWRAAGLSDSTIGSLWALGVIVEVALFAFGNQVLARLGPKGLLLTAAAGGVVRWTVLALTTHPAALFAVQGLHGLTYAAGHLGAMHFIARAVPQSHAVRAQGLYSALAMGALLGLSMIAAGWLYARADGFAFLLGTALCVGAGVLGVLLVRRWDGGALWGSGSVSASP